MRPGRWVPALFTSAIFLAAALLFVIQPMVGKMVLPRAGGSPQVWNTSLVFFQTALLGGYLYAHLTVRWLGVRRQAIVHIAVLILPLLVLPIALPAGNPGTGGGQSWWILVALTVAVGAPFFVLSSASPLIQTWLAATTHETSEDPYFLYAGSNAGSLVGLLAFPFLLEPLLPVGSQAALWTAGYATFVGLGIICALVAIVSESRRSKAGTAVPEIQAISQEEAVTRNDRLFWLASAAVPSALLLGVTQYLTSQIAPISLLWVLPLAVYLATFVAAFARRQFVSTAVVSRFLAILTVVTALTLLARIYDPAWAISFLHLALLGAAGLLCHTRLAESRPSTSHLTEYYLLISTGGAIGGSLSALVAPVVFDFIAEYPIAVVLACLLRIPFAPPGELKGPSRFLFKGRALDVVLPALLLLYVVLASAGTRAIEDMPDGITVVLVAVVPTIIAFVFSPRPLRFALGMAVLLGAAESGQMYRGQILHQERTFFGVHRVSRDPDNTVNILYHGSTVHGVQSLDPSRAREPLGYYHPSGPSGSLVQAIATQPDKTDIALVGAGTGALAVLAAPHQHVTLYEIDPAVVRLASESGFFTYLANTEASYDIVVGDGRLALSESSTRFDLIVLDAFSSGTIPLHLLTEEAFDLYLDRLKDGGILLFHISNRHLELAPVLAAHARDRNLASYEWVDVRDDEAVERGIFGSHWVLLTRDPQDLAFVAQAGWRSLAHPGDTRTWTDDFSDLLSVQRWN
ncbi:MAG: fused MFS/spermidine synthase [Gemmatimonadota bacterium]|nr:fused MFS/spermidine synthase [Gemmatimonadota bacterium]